MNIEKLKEEARAVRAEEAAKQKAEEDAERQKAEESWRRLRQAFQTDFPELAEFVESETPAEMLSGQGWDGTGHYCHQIQIHAIVPGHRPISIRYSREGSGQWERDRSSARPWITCSEFVPDPSEPENPNRYQSVSAKTLGEALLLAEEGQRSYEAAIVEGKAMAARKMASAEKTRKPLPTNDHFCSALRDWLIEDGFARDEEVEF